MGCPGDGDGGHDHGMTSTHGRPAAAMLPAAVTTRAARTAGLSPGQLRHPSLLTPTPGVRVRADASPTDVARAVLAVAPIGSALSHVSAARMLSLPTPTPWSSTEPLHIVSPGTRCRRDGVVGHRGRRPTCTAHGVAVTTPAATWRDLCADPGWTVEDLVVLGDAVLRRGPTAVNELADAAATPGPGVRRAREVLPLVRPGSESPGESRSRLLAVSAGLPEPELNGWILDELDVPIARGDLVWRERRVVGEYEGDHHRTDRAQWQHDIARTRRLEQLGYRVVRITAADLATEQARAALVALLRGALC